jgi:glycosyltransferase involved in cell wall biosynthesis
MRELGPGFRLLIAGQGEPGYLKSLKRRAAGLPIEFVGYVSLPEYFDEIDVLIVPSWQEPFGIVTLEAMASGIPVVGTGPAEILRGTLIPPRNPSALADAIRDATLDPTARDHVVGKFDIRTVVPKIEEFYASVSS